MQVLDLLLLGGAPRSGTTAMVGLLNAHSKILLGQERYKFLYQRCQKTREPVPADLFRIKRFLTVRPTDTNTTLKRLGTPEQIDAKFRSARYIGDKQPDLNRCYPVIAARYQPNKIIIMFREPQRVCSSFNVRAANPKDRWNPQGKFDLAVRMMNDENRFAARLFDQNPDSLLALCYESLLLDPSGVVDLLLSFLELDPEDEFIAKVTDNIAVAKMVAQKPLVVLEGQEAFIAEHFDRSAYENMRRMMDYHLNRV